MRHLISIAILLIFLVFPPSSSAALKGNLEYKIPIDYSVLDEKELAEKADGLYNLVILRPKLDLDMEVITVLNLYSTLTNMNPSNIQYAIRLGRLYDKLDKGRYAKMCYYRAMGVEPSNPEPYFYLGEYYYKREQYRKALKFYNEAYQKGYPDTTMLKKVYKKLGDQTALEKLEQK